MPNYIELATKAQDIITRFGRAITLEKIDRTPADAAKPWRGPTDPEASPTATLSLDGVFIEPSHRI